MTSGYGIPRVSLPDFPAGEATPVPGVGAAWARLLSSTPLLHMSPEGVVTGGLASSWSLSPDRTSIELQLRPDALFADGSRITAADVVASLSHARDLHAGSSESWRWEHVASIEMPAHGVVRLVLNEPDASVLALLTSYYVPVMPATWISRGWNADGPFPPSSGCFQLASVSPERLRFSRHPGFFQVGRPRLAGVICNAPPSAITRTTELVTSSVDLLIDAPLLDVPTLQEDPNIVLVGGPTNRLCLLTANLQGGSVADPRLRRLISSAIDRETLVTAAAGDEAVPASTLIPPDHWAGLEYTTERAEPDEVRAQLATLGEPPGVELRLVASSTDASLANACVLLQEQMAWAGISLSLDLLDDAEMEEEMASGTWDLAMMYTPWWRDPHELVRTLVVTDGASNLGGYSQGRLDYLAGLAARAGNDEYRGGFYRTIQGIVVNDAPVIPLFFPNYYDAMSARLQNYPFHSPISATAMNQVTMPRPDPVQLP
jgi:peptide/nickel transport system substrate-binding protein